MKIIEYRNNLSLRYVLHLLQNFLYENNIKIYEQDLLLKLDQIQNEQVSVKSYIEGKHPISLLSDYIYLEYKQEISESLLTKEIANATGETYQELKELNLKSHEICHFIPENFASKWQILALGINNKCLSIAHCQPFEKRWVKWLEQTHICKIDTIITPPKDLYQSINEHYQFYHNISNANNNFSIQENHEMEDIDKAHVVKIVSWIMNCAIKYRASDIHLEPTDNALNMRLRVDDSLIAFHQFSKVLKEPIINRIKIMSGLDISEHRHPQDGRFNFTYNINDNKYNIIESKLQEDSNECRVSIIPMVHGEKVVIRIQRSQQLQTFSQLGMPKNIEEQWDKLIHNSAGIILVTGPTGSGKTSTLYASLQKLQEKNINITTIEDPVELQIPQFNQMSVNSEIGLDFASGLRAILRQDPNVIMIGEIRDNETAEIALQAALTGHLVISTVHTIDSVTAIIRLMELGVPTYVIRATLIGVLSQRLVRKICPDCRDVNRKNNSLASKARCTKCLDTGYFDRIGIFELLTLDAKSRESIHENISAQVFRQNLIKEGMIPLKRSAQQLIEDGVTSETEVERVYSRYLDSE